MNQITCRQCSEPIEQGIVSIRHGHIAEPTALCEDCIAENMADKNHGQAPQPDALPREDETPIAFVARTDHAVQTWWSNATWTPALGHAIAFGELQAVTECAAIAREYGVDVSLVLGAFLAGRTGLRRRRDSMNFARSLASFMKAKENERNGDPDERA